MDPASEELEQRSRYLSSLIRRTKLHAAPALAPPPPTPPPEPETKLQLEMEPQPERVEEAAKKPAAVAAVVEKREVKGGGGGGGQAGKGKGKGKGKEKEMEKGKEERKVSVRVRAADMPLAMQRRAVRLAFDAVAAMPRLDSKRLALALKKVKPSVSPLATVCSSYSSTRRQWHSAVLGW
jgi:dynein light chain LC8-type